MAAEINLPELGENVEGGTVVEVYVTTGDQVSEGQALMEVEAGKSTVEVPAPFSATIRKILVMKGDEVKTGQPLFQVETDGVAKQDKKKEPPAKEPPAEAPAQKAAETKPAPKDDKPPAKVPERAAAPHVQPVRSQPTVPDAEEVPPDKPGKLVLASPATRLLARELGVDLSQVRGSARHGRVTQDDVKAYVRQLAAGARALQTVSGVQAPPLPDFGKWGEVERKPLDTIRRETAKQMAISWALVPHVTQHDLADITDLESFRKSQPKDGPKITVTAFAVKAAAIALREFPQFNATLDLPNHQLILKKYYNIGVAVDTERGLLVPVLRDADKKSVLELAVELAEAAERARQRKLSANDLAGGTFTITNLGGIGGTAFTPIINYPEVAILGMSRGQLQPVIRDGQMVPRMMLPLSLSYDHRVIDGADAARFTRRIVLMLEKPLEMLLHA